MIGGSLRQTSTALVETFLALRKDERQQYLVENKFIRKLPRLFIKKSTYLDLGKQIYVSSLQPVFRVHSQSLFTKRPKEINIQYY